MARFREYAQGQVYLLPPALDEFIGDNELVRVVDRVIGQLDLKCLVISHQTTAELYADDVEMK